VNGRKNIQKDINMKTFISAAKSDSSP